MVCVCVRPAAVGVEGMQACLAAVVRVALHVAVCATGCCIVMCVCVFAAVCCHAF